MALIDRIKYEAPDDKALAWKHPSDQVKLGAQLIVNEGQQAIFVKGGQLLDTFDPGTHTLATGNIPLIDKIVNLAFAGDTPFTAEVWYVNTTVKRDLKWGTKSPIPFLDPNLGFPVSIRSYGKWGIRIHDAQSFLTQIVGSQASKDSGTIYEYFIGQIIQSLTNQLTTELLEGKKSILEIATSISEIAEATSKLIEKEFSEYGLEVINFNIESINIPNDELKRVQDVFYKTLEAKELSKTQTGGAYAQIKSFEILKDAADNPSDGAVGAMLGAGIGLGAGFPVGQKMGSQLTTDSSTDQKKNDIADDPVQKLKKLKMMLDEKLITQEQFDEKQKIILKDL